VHAPSSAFSEGEKKHARFDGVNRARIHVVDNNTLNPHRWGACGLARCGVGGYECRAFSSAAAASTVDIILCAPSRAMRSAMRHGLRLSDRRVHGWARQGLGLALGDALGLAFMVVVVRTHGICAVLRSAARWSRWWWAGSDARDRVLWLVARLAGGKTLFMLIHWRVLLRHLR